MNNFKLKQIRVNCGSYTEKDGLVVLEGLTNNAIEVYDSEKCKYFSLNNCMNNQIEELNDVIDDLRDMDTDKLLIEELRDEVDDLNDDIDSLKQEITILNNQLRDKD